MLDSMIYIDKGNGKTCSINPINILWWNHLIKIITNIPWYWCQAHRSVIDRLYLAVLLEKVDNICRPLVTGYVTCCQWKCKHFSHSHSNLFSCLPLPDIKPHLPFLSPLFQLESEMAALNQLTIFLTYSQFYQLLCNLYIYTTQPT